MDRRPTPEEAKTVRATLKLAEGIAELEKKQQQRRSVEKRIPRRSAMWDNGVRAAWIHRSSVVWSEALQRFAAEDRA